MRLNPIVIALGLAATGLAVLSVADAGAAQKKTAGPAGAEPFALSDRAAVQDITSAIERYRVDLGAGAAAGTAPVRRADGPWFGLKLANPTSLPMERLLIVRRPLLGGAGWSAGTASALPRGAAVEWVGAGAPEALPSLPGTGGAGVYQFTIPANGTASLAIPGAEGPVLGAVMTRAAYAGSTSFRFVILGLGLGLLGVLAALSFARWLGEGDRAAAASAGVGLAAIWVLATQFGHHLPLTGAESPLDAGLKAAGLFALASALLFSVHMQAALSQRFLSVLKWGALACAAMAAVALPVSTVTVAAGPVLLAATLLALGAAVTDALNHRERLNVRLPDLVSLMVLAAVLIAAGVLAVTEPSLTADRWSLALHGAMIVALAVLGGSGLIVHHGVAVPLLAEFHPPASERAETDVSSALGPEPAGADLSHLEIPPGPGRAVPAEPAADAAASAGNEELVTDLREALARREVHVEYQPIVALADGSIAGFEALARWERKGHGPVPPGVFVPLAERTGLISELGGQVLEQAAERLGDWQRRYGRGANRRLRMNVNLSAGQLDAPGLEDRVADLIEDKNLEPGTLTLELTESAKPRDAGRAADTLRRLKELGAGLVLDDFGTGYASLETLATMPFDGLKIAHTFVQAEDERTRSIVQAIIALAHDLDMTVTAEGVRQAADLERLRTVGCEYVQGPFCGSPLPSASAEAVLRRGAGAAPSRDDKAEPFSAGSA